MRWLLFCHSKEAVAPSSGRTQATSRFCAADPNTIASHWPNRDLNVGAIVSLAPNLKPFTDLLGVDVATVKKVLADPRGNLGRRHPQH